MKKVYPAIFTVLEDACLVEIPDMQVLTEAKDLEDAFSMARDAIGVKGIAMEDDGEELPRASKLTDINPAEGAFAEEGGETYVLLVDVDFDIYRKKHDQKMVRRNVTLPMWLNYEADLAGVNVSGILQEALIKKLDLRR